MKKLLRENSNVNSLGVNVSRPNQVLILMRGIPGSGKSTTARQLAKGGVIHSTDDLIDAQGDYKSFFDNMKSTNNFSALSKMYSNNLKNAIKSMSDGISPVVIDNTNIRPSEMKSYVVAALELGFSDENIKFENVGTGGASAEELAKRNLHGVPLDKINQMIQSYNSFNQVKLKDILNAKDMGGDILYSAVVLDDISRNMLLRIFDSYIPKGWKTFAHHMTIAFGKPVKNEDLNKSVGLVVKKIGISDMAVALEVDGYPSENKIPHVTLAVNPQGGKPVMSNDIKNWKTIENVKIKGIVKNIRK
jgi:predicted kinase